MKRKKLICFAYAGGSSVIYQSWVSDIDFEVVPFDIPGRGTRMNEPLYTDINDLIENLLTELVESVIHKNDELFLFGYSMGALIAFEVAKRLEQISPKQVKHVFVAAKGSPCTTDWMEKYSDLEEQELLNKLLKKGGITKEFIDSRELIDIFLPIIRADYQLIEGYCCDYKKISIPITVLFGSEDTFSKQEILGWKNHSISLVNFREFVGDHFFIRNNQQSILSFIKETSEMTLVV
ncbi:thioesterase II family protein [Peribacillus simplex]|uniref:thioesterase II family protein n=1 Tax=Peribacillus simplex TaxID=1478 RepID=UPI003D284893